MTVLIGKKPSDVQRFTRSTFWNKAYEEVQFSGQDVSSINSHYTAGKKQVKESSVGGDFKFYFQLVAVTTPYFMAETAPGERLLHKVKGKMPLQFGR